MGLSLRLAVVSIVVAVAISTVTVSLLLPSFAQQQLPPAYTNVTAASATASSIGINVFEVITAANIPQVPDTYINNTLAFGYAWRNSTTFPSNAVVATIHPNANLDSQNPNLWHPHTTTINSAGCITGLTTSQAAVSISDNGLWMKMNATEAVVSSSSFISASSFKLVSDSTNCPSPLPGLRMATP